MPDIAIGNNIVMRLLGRKTKGRLMQILHECYEPGADTGESMLRHEGEEGGIVIKGSIQLTVGDRVEALHKGDGYYFNSRLPHRFLNNSSEICEIISANSPPSF
jgi:Mannose-6-phosphate isomerase